MSADATTWLAARAGGDGDAVAVASAGREWTWAQLATRADAVAGSLARLGVVRGDIVAAWLAPGLLPVALLHACQAVGAALLPVNTRLSAAEAARVLEHARPRVVVAGDDFPAAAGRAGAALVGQREVEIAGAPRGFVVPRRFDPTEALTVVYTSGTTAAPKGVVLSSANHAASAAASARRLGHGRGDSWLAAMPLFHVGGLAILVRSVLDGSRVLLDDRFDAARAASALERGEATMVPMVPTMLGRALDAMRSPASPRLRAVLVGGAALSPALGARALAAGLPVSATWGMTETASQIATSAPGSADASSGRVGRPLDGCEVRVDAPDRDGRGEFLVRGPSVARGYLRNDEADRAAFVAADGGRWLRTGDVGTVHDDGSLSVAGRADDLVVTGGENVSPLEVEQVLDSHPAVLESLACGEDDAVWGQRLVATVVLRDGMHADEAALDAWCRERLASYKVPRSFGFATGLPRGATGKLLRRRG